MASTTLAAFFTVDRELWPLTLTFERYLDSVKMKLRKHLGQRPSKAKREDTHIPDLLLYPDH